MCFTWWWRYCAWLLSLKQEKKNRQLRKKKKLKQTQSSLATLLVLEGTHIRAWSILNNQKCLRTHFKVDFCLFCTVLAANLFKYGRKRWVSWFKVTYLNMLTCFFFVSKTVFNVTRSKEIVYFKCRAQSQITKRLWTAEICILCGHRCC